MTRLRRADAGFSCRHLQQDIIFLRVRWSVSYRLGYHDLVAMLAQGGIRAVPSMIYRWVQRFVPEFEKRRNARRKTVGISWRVDETYSLSISVMA